MKRTFLLVVTFGFCVATGAQTSLDTIHSAKKDTIAGLMTKAVVVKGCKPEDSETVPAQKLEGSQLKRLGGHGVADAMRFFSGVQVKDYGGIGGLKTLNVHGMGSEHVSVVYDGIPIDNAQNGQVDLGRFSLDNVESIALYTGGRSGILQPARNFASASSVYLRTRTPVFVCDSDNASDLHDIKPYNIKASLRGGSFGTINPAMRWEQRWNANLSSAFSTEYICSTGRYKYRYHLDDGYDTTATRHNGEMNAVRSDASLFGTLRHGDWRVQGYVFHSRRGLPGAVVRNGLRNIDKQWDLNTFLQSSLIQRFERYALLVNAKYAYDYLHYLHEPRGNDGSSRIDNRYKQQQVYISAAQTYELLAHWNVSLSTDYIMNGLEADIYNFARPLRHAIYIAAATAWNVPRLSAQANVLLTQVNNRVRHKSGGKSANFTEATPAVFASCRPFVGKDLTVRAFYKRMFRLPTLNDLYYTFLGNSDLKPEYATQYDIGFTFRHTFSRISESAVEFKMDTYYNRVSDKIVAVPTANMFRWTMMNIGLVRIFGIDAAAQMKCRIGAFALSAKGTYTHQRARDCSDSDSRYYGGQIAYIPRHAVSAVLAVDWHEWALNYSFLYTGERYDASANISANRIHPWRTHDASVLRRFTLGKVSPEVLLAVNNIFNQQYEVVKCYPMPGRNYKITLSVNI